MSLTTYTLSFDGAMTDRGFWLYVWRVSAPDNRELLYVGMTGDTSSPNAASPFGRMGQHLDPKSRGNALFQYLKKCKVPASACRFELIAHGPVLQEVSNMGEHKEPWSKVSSVEKALHDALVNAGYQVMNPVNSRQPLDTKLWDQVRAAFAKHFPGLGQGSG